MPVVIVGNLNGKAVIHWRGVLIATLVIFCIGIAMNLLFMAAVGWWEPSAFRSLYFSTLWTWVVILGMGIRRGLRMPPDRLSTL